MMIVLTPHLTWSQKNLIRNPSFDGYAQGPRIDYWINTGDPREAPPYIHSETRAFFYLYAEPFEGTTYLCMVTRPNGSVSSISQRLRKPLIPGERYKFSVWVMQSPIMMSATREAPTIFQDFTNPVRLQLSGRTELQDPGDVLLRSGPKSNLEWTKLQYEFVASKAYRYITIEASFPDEKNATAGHLLLDLCSLVHVPGQPATE